MLSEDAPPALDRSGEQEEQEEPPEDQAEESQRSSRRSAWGYLAGSSHLLGLGQRFSRVYQDASRSLQATRQLLPHVGVAEVKVALLHYASKVTQELPLLHRLEPRPPAEAPQDLGLDGAPAEAKGQAPDPPQGFTPLDLPGVSTWPEGSVWSLREERPEVFLQKLVQLPSGLAHITSLSPPELLQQLQVLVPQDLGQPLGIFWLETASRQLPLQEPGFLLLSEEEVLVLSPGGAPQAPSVARFRLEELQEVQVGLAGQLLHLQGRSHEALLAVFTYSKDLTQEFLRVLVRAHCPQPLPQEVRGHPLLSADLMLLSLDWRSHTPDLVLDGGLRLTSRFQRALADLLYVVHGNTDGPDRPPLAHTRPLLLTSVGVASSRPHLCQLLLTETHLVLLRQDAVPPASPGSALAPPLSRAPPPFRALQLRHRSHVGCVFVKQSDTWLLLDVTFTPERRRGSRRSSLEAWPASRRHGDSWKLSLGCTDEALMLINHLCLGPEAGSLAGGS